MALHAPNMLPRLLRSQSPRQSRAALLSQPHHDRHLQQRLYPRSFLLRTISTTPSLAHQKGTRRRRNADGNPNRGVSAMRHTGLREPLSVSKFELPKPVLDPAKRDKVVTDEDHGLWGFFNAKRQRLSGTMDEEAYGRAWQPAELRTKSWEDLHGLWWVCLKERNRLATLLEERARLNTEYGEAEYKSRTEIVMETQKAIKKVLTERWLAWEKARIVAMDDDTVDLSGDGPALNPFPKEHLLEDPRRDPNAPVEI